MRYNNLIHIEAGSFREKTHVKVVFKERRTLNLDQLIERMHLDDLNALGLSSLHVSLTSTNLTVSLQQYSTSAFS